MGWVSAEKGEGGGWVGGWVGGWGGVCGPPDRPRPALRGGAALPSPPAIHLSPSFSLSPRAGRAAPGWSGTHPWSVSRGRERKRGGGGGEGKGEGRAAVKRACSASAPAPLAPAPARPPFPPILPSARAPGGQHDASPSHKVPHSWFIGAPGAAAAARAAARPRPAFLWATTRPAAVVATTARAGSAVPWSAHKSIRRQRPPQGWAGPWRGGAGRRREEKGGRGRFVRWGTRVRARGAARQRNERMGREPLSLFSFLFLYVSSPPGPSPLTLHARALGQECPQGPALASPPSPHPHPTPTPTPTPRAFPRPQPRREQGRAFFCGGGARWAGRGLPSAPAAAPAAGRGTRQRLGRPTRCLTPGPSARPGRQPRRGRWWPLHLSPLSGPPPAVVWSW